MTELDVPAVEVCASKRPASIGAFVFAVLTAVGVGVGHLVVRSWLGW